MQPAPTQLDDSAWRDIDADLLHARHGESLEGASILEAALRPVPGVTLHQRADAGDGGWRPLRAWLSSPRGLHRGCELSSPLLAVVAACDGTTPLREVLLRASLDLDEGARLVRPLVELGLLDPCPAGDGTARAPESMRPH